MRRVWVVSEHIAEGILKEFVVPFESMLPVIFFCDSGVVSFFELLAGNCCCSVGCNGAFLAVGQFVVGWCWPVDSFCVVVVADMVSVG